MKLLPTACSVCITCTLFLPVQTLASDLFLFIDESDRIPLNSETTPKRSLDIEFADVNLDGALDLWIIEGSSGVEAFQNRLLINDGSGNFSDQSITRLPQMAMNSSEVDLADVDQDGDADAVIANLGDTELLINDGSGHYSFGVLPNPAPPGPPGFVVPFPPFFIKVSAEAIFADVDGNGTEDILVSNENPFPPSVLPGGPAGDANEIYMNDGSGNFSSETDRLPFAIDNTSGIVSADVNNDGHDDLVIANIGQNLLYINDGTGFFVDETEQRLPVLLDATRKIAVGDVDGDSFPDLVIGNSRGEPDRLYFNDGTGVFTDVSEQNLPADSATSTDIDLIDLNNDGSLDIVVTNSGEFVFGTGFLGEPNRLYLNDGTGRFTDATFPRLPVINDRSTNAEFGDVNGDGIVDLAIANSGGASQPGLQAEDGLERLYIRTDCTQRPTRCHQEILALLARTIENLDTAAFPEGDMPFTNERVNQILQHILMYRVSRAEHALKRAKQRRYSAILRQIAVRTDARDRPFDWVSGEPAAVINGYVEFVRRVVTEAGI